MVGGFNAAGEALGTLVLSDIPAADSNQTNVNFREEVTFQDSELLYVLIFLPIYY